MIATHPPRRHEMKAGKDQPRDFPCAGRDRACIDMSGEVAENAVRAGERQYAFFSPILIEIGSSISAASYVMIGNEYFKEKKVWYHGLNSHFQ